MRKVLLSFALAACTAGAALGQSDTEQVKPRWLTIDNRLRYEYDDNYSTTSTNELDSFKIMEQLQIIGELNMDETFASIRLQPSYIYWSDRDDDTDWHTEMDLIFSHYFNPRLKLGVTDNLRKSELPELRDDRGVTLRQDNEYFYNSLNASLSYWLRPRLNLTGSGRHVMLLHMDDEVANKEDYDLYAGGLSLSHQFGKNTSLSGDFRYETVKYPNDPDRVTDDADEVFIEEGGDRGSSSYSIGTGLNHEFSPNLLAAASAGFSHKSYDNANTDSTGSPYAQGSVTFLPSPATRLTTGAAYGLYEADVYPFVNQQRASVFVSLAHDMSEKLSWYVSGTHIRGEYEAAETTDTVEEDAIRDGTDRSYMLSARVQYEIVKNNALELGWQFSKLDSDVREDFTRNRYSIGWKLRL